MATDTSTTAIHAQIPGSSKSTNLSFRGFWDYLFHHENEMYCFRSSSQHASLTLPPIPHGQTVVHKPSRLRVWSTHHDTRHGAFFGVDGVTCIIAGLIHLYTTVFDSTGMDKRTCVIHPCETCGSRVTVLQRSC